MKKYAVLTLLMCCLSFHVAAQKVQPDTITMAFFGHEGRHQYFNLLYTEAFRRLGIKFTYQIFPMKRCSAMADAGAVDGEPARIIHYNKVYSNLIRVEASSVANDYLAFTTDADIQLDGWNSLKDTPYRVDYIVGSMIAKNNLEKVIQADLLFSSATVEQGFKKLLGGRVDIFVHDKKLTMPIFESPKFNQAGIVIAGRLQRVVGYPYLHKRHILLVPKVAAVLNQMKAEGLLEKYQVQATQFFNSK